MSPSSAVFMSPNSSPDCSHVTGNVQRRSLPGVAILSTFWSGPKLSFLSSLCLCSCSPAPQLGAVFCYLPGGLQGSPGRSWVAGLRVPLILFTGTFILHIKCKSPPPPPPTPAASSWKRWNKTRRCGFSFSKLALNMWPWVSHWILGTFVLPSVQ